MAVTYPGAEYRQLSGKSVTPLDPRVIDVHTMVWWLDPCEDYFAVPGNPYSHFGTGYDGEVRQWQDLESRAASDLDGNPFCVSIENSDRGVGFPPWSGSDVPRFTDAQAEALAQLIAWLCVRFDIPPVLVPDSLPGRVGPGWHRQGIDPWRVPGGVRYSSHAGKVCPGDRRIAQLQYEIMPRVVRLVALASPDVAPANLYLGDSQVMSLTHQPNSNWINLCVVGVGGAVFHYAVPSLEALTDAVPENLGGDVRSVTCDWAGDTFVVIGEGRTDQRMYAKYFRGGQWSPGWYNAPVNGVIGPEPPPAADEPAPPPFPT